MCQFPERAASHIQLLLRAAAKDQHMPGATLPDTRLWQLFEWLTQHSTSVTCQNTIQEVLRIAKKQSWPDISVNANSLHGVLSEDQAARSFFEQMEACYLR